MMYTLIYSSNVVKYMGNIDISSLLYAARKNNAAHKITGILIYSNGHFMHVIEGEEEAVRKTFETVNRDRRHENLKILLEKEINERRFPGWSLGFKYIPDKELDKYPQLVPLLKDAGSASEALDFSDEIYDYITGFSSETECCDAFF